MLRSPSEYYLRFLASHEHLGESEVIAQAQSIGIKAIPGGAEYIRRLRDDMPLPLNYDPKNPAHKPSMDFLEESGIYDMWYPTDATKRALQIFKIPQRRDIVVTLLSTPMTLPKISEYLLHRYAMDVQIRTLQEFKHYFWNTDLLSEEDKTMVLNSPGASVTARAAATSYKDALGPPMILWKMGHLPTKIDKSLVFNSLRNIAFLNALEVDRTIPQGRHKASAFHDYAEVVIQAQNKLDDFEAQEYEVIQDFYRQITVGSADFHPKGREELNIEAREVSNVIPTEEEYDDGESE